MSEQASAQTQRLDMTLDDRMTVEEGWVYMTGMQALVRLPMQQRIRDIARNLNTAGFISGYRGSPLGRYDMELWNAQDTLERYNVVFQPGVNEDLAATATWGSQYVGTFPGNTVDGVFSIWYPPCWRAAARPWTGPWTRCGPPTWRVPLHGVAACCW